MSKPAASDAVNDNPLAWVRLAAVSGLGPIGARKLLQAFGLPQRILGASAASLASVVGERLAGAILTHDAGPAVERARAWLDVPGHHLVTLADAGYPPGLLEIPDPPILLYVHGRVELLSQPALAVVGARNATPQGMDNAESFARALAQAGLTIVSGLALGIDAAAHRGALGQAGSTIAVIGTGADRIYPARNEALARRIAAEGAIVSEFPLGTGPLKENFPRRNRLIAGLARGVLVVEAAERSGSLITARQAAEQGREVFAIPGSIHSPLSKGCHRLIRQGAKLVDSTADIVEELGWHTAAGAAAPCVAAPAEADVLLDAMGFDPVSVDELVGRTGLTPAELSAKLLELELAGQATNLPGGRFQRLA